MEIYASGQNINKRGRGCSPVLQGNMTEDKTEAKLNERLKNYEFPIWIPLRRKFTPDGPFFAAGNAERELLAKQVTLELTKDEREQINSMQNEEFWDLPCPIIGCGARLSVMTEFEDHYFARHTAMCSICFKVFPTSFLLNIHVSESHDSFFQAKVARGYPMYECLVEGCGVKFPSDRSRHQHLVDKHKFPISFEFHKKHHPSKRQRQRLRARLGLKQSETYVKPRSHSGQSAKPFPDSDALPEMTVLTKGNAKSHVEKENMEAEPDIDLLTSAVSKLSTKDNAPSVVTFGRRHNRAFAFVPRAMHNKTIIKQDRTLNDGKVSFN